MAAVASRSSNNSPHLGGSNMQSPKDSKKTQLKTEVPSRKASPFSQDARPGSPRAENRQAIPVIKQPDESNDEHKEAPLPNAPLAPPPRPSQNNGGEPDYFGANHTAHLIKEPNPFESAFGNPVETPGKPQLPGVTSLTSPAPLLPGNTPGWPGSLRSGPLSPAMLTGPTGSNDYFNSDHHFAGSFPTPNESSLRTGLTPGGGGSMFPAPSPNSQAIFNAIQSGGATPGTLDFHRTAMHARAVSNPGQFVMPQTSQPQDPNIQPNLDSKSFNQQQQQQQQQHQQQQQQPNNDPFEQHDANDAANGLYLLAQARGGGRGQPQQYPPPQQQPQMNYMNNAHIPMGQQSHNTSPDMNNNRASKNSIASNMSGSTQNERDYSENSEEAKPSTRSRGGKKGSSAKGAINGRRKAEDTPSKGLGNNKRQKGNHGMMNMPDEDDSDEMEEDDEDAKGPDGKKMTDEEKRKNFLERNRVAALKCRQRKKQWLANLQQKVEIFSTENDALAATVTQLREEIVGLKTLLLAHKDCPVSQAQGISGMAMQNIAGDQHQFGNPYGMSMMGGQGMPQGNMRR